MKFSCEKNMLSQAISIASRAAASKSPNPALEGLLLEAMHNLRLTGYDLKKGIYTSIDADVEDAGSVIVPAKLFGDIVRKLPDGIVSFTSDESYMIHIVCGKADYIIMGSTAEDYPELPSTDYTTAVTMEQVTFSQMITETAFAISTNESRPVYTGAMLEVKDDIMTMIAVDGFRLALRREAVMGCDVEEISFIVPGTALRDMEKLCVTPDEPVRIFVGAKHINFRVGDTVLITRRLEGEFLNYKKTLPTSFPKVCAANRSDLIRCAERVSLIIDDRTKNPLRCTFTDDTLSISCTTPRGSAEDSCPIEANGEKLLIGFNNSYLLDALKAAPADRLLINLSNASSPCIITPEDGNDDFLYMILPVRMSK